MNCWRNPGVPKPRPVANAALRKSNNQYSFSHAWQEKHTVLPARCTSAPGAKLPKTPHPAALHQIAAK